MLNIIITEYIKNVLNNCSPGPGFTYGEVSFIFNFRYFIPIITTAINTKNVIDNAINNGKYDDAEIKKNNEIKKSKGLE